MALIKCPECNKEVSDYAEACPHCGYPLKKKPVTSNLDDRVSRIIESEYNARYKASIFVCIIGAIAAIVFLCMAASELARTGFFPVICPIILSNSIFVVLFFKTIF